MNLISENKSLLKKIMYYGFGNGLKAAVPLLMMKFLTDQLTKSEMGTLSLIEAIILFVIPFISINLSSGIVVEYNHRNKKELASYISSGILNSICITVLLSFIFLLSYNQLNKNTEIPFLIFILIPVFSLLKVLFDVALTLFRIREKAVEYSFINVSQSIFDFLASILLVVFMGIGLVGRLYGVYFSLFIFSLGLVIYMYRNEYFKIHLNLNELKNIYRYGGPLILHVISSLSIAFSDRFFLNYFFNNEEVGLYFVAFQMSSILMLVAHTVNLGWMPKMFKLLKDQKLKTIKKNNLYFFLFYLFVFFALLVFKNIIYKLLVNPTFNLSKEYYNILLLSFLVQATYLLLTNYFFYYKKTVLLSKITVFGAVVNLVLNYILITKIGVVGVAYSTLITWCIYLVLICYFIKKNKWIE